MVVQWLRLGAFTVEGLGSIPGQASKSLQATGQKKKKALVKDLNIVAFKAIFMYIAFI